MQRVRKAVIPAAGLGTRLLPATKAMPKEMLPVVDKPVIQYIVEEAVAAGIEDILIVTGKGKRAIEDHFDRSVELEALLQDRGKRNELETIRAISEMANIHYIRQKEPLGLGHAVWCARRFIGDEPFAVLLGDVLIQSEEPALVQLLRRREVVGGAVIGIQPVAAADVHKYGIIDGVEMEPGLFRVRRMVEKPRPEEAPSNLAILGRYVLPPQVFTHLEHASAGALGEIQLTDALAQLAVESDVYGLTVQGRTFDIGSPLGWLEATVAMALADPALGDGVRRILYRELERTPGR
ncbi:MAG: UTP--glucose-1-phosphate uridylyltransferase GalU [Thermoflavifilum sp.]|nr:UTP--glucose-1-phosphate uridylyltransferase GalU [Thermoflavifilum sp.]MCL6513727.1 UTP--glucose-1-phosphate uridylyltransferase GalU [Alicyclobacillus sp.]